MFQTAFKTFTTFCQEQLGSNCFRSLKKSRDVGQDSISAQLRTSGHRSPHSFHLFYPSQSANDLTLVIFHLQLPSGRKINGFGIQDTLLLLNL